MSAPRHRPNPVAGFFEPAIRWLLYAAGWWLMAIVALTCVEIVGRKLFGFSLQGVDEIGGYTLGVTASLALSWAMIHRGHTRVDFLLGRLPPPVQAACNAAAMVSLAALACYAALRGITVLSESIEFQSRSTTPLQVRLWIPQAGWLAGWALFALMTLALAVHAVYLAVRDRAALNALYGPMTVEEEVEAELGEEAAAVARPARESSGA